MALFMALSFFFSGMEAGVFALSRLRIRQFMRRGRPAARVLHGYLEDPENFLWTILVGNTLANFVVAGLAVLQLHVMLGGRPVLFWLSVALMIFVFYTTCDLLPKMLFRMYPNRLCMALVKPFRILHALLAPLVSPLAGLSALLLRWSGGRTFTGRIFGSREELRLVMQESEQNLTSDERTMINRVLELRHRTVGQVSRAMEMAVAVTTQTPMKDVLQLSKERNLTRFPVWQRDDGKRRIVGVVSLKTLLYSEDLDPARTAGDYVKPALFLKEEMRLEEALRQFQRSGQRMAIVVGRDQREVGFVTLQNVLDVLFGEVTL
jgi:putative hemolysin